MNIISGWTRHPSTMRLGHSIRLLVRTGLMKHRLISLVELKRQKRWLPTSGCPITLISRLEPATEATTSHQQKDLDFFNPFETNGRLPNPIPAYAAAIVDREYQA
ncbi:hypothetical protein FOXYSP1_16960 [Fusarium oxysporum f. sp. phaseoli]